MEILTYTSIFKKYYKLSDSNTFVYTNNDTLPEIETAKGMSTFLLINVTY